ncbi:MAG: hypothetical protein KKC46_22395, partial [Proteobacteria bacterium]|nr:hypothetical protein [Pseudomonadota bacterium]
SSDDIVPGDTVTFAQTANFTDKNVGTDKTINIADITLGGSDGSNYALTETTDTAAADITARAVTAAYAGTNKVYDATTTAIVTGSSDDIVPGDTVTFAQTADFTDKNVGTGKTINIADITLGGSDGSNYALTETTDTATADITKAAIFSTANNDNKTAALNSTFGILNATQQSQGDIRKRYNLWLLDIGTGSNSLANFMNTILVAPQAELE